MAEKQVTTMVIKVDLGCEKCIKKIKKILCKLPEIQNQTYDPKANTVTITVVSCYPEKIKKKICCKGGEIVKSIEIKVPEKPKPKSPEPVKGIPVPICPKKCCSECYQWCGGGPCLHGCGTSTPPCKEPCCTPAPLCKETCERTTTPCKEPCCRPTPPCKETCGRTTTPCKETGCRPTPPCNEPCGKPTPLCYEPCGRTGFDSFGRGGCSCRSKGYYSCRCEYAYDNSPSSCTIM